MSDGELLAERYKDRKADKQGGWQAGTHNFLLDKSVQVSKSILGAREEGRKQRRRKIVKDGPRFFCLSATVYTFKVKTLNLPHLGQMICMICMIYAHFTI